MKFVLRPDAVFGDHFLLPPARGEDGSRGAPKDRVSFLHTEMEVTPRKTGPFHSDLTDRYDDVFIASLSSLLLLVVPALLTSVLSYNTPTVVPAAGISVAQFFELVRGVKRALRGVQVPHLMIKLPVFAVTLGLGLVVIVCSQPDYREVTNHDVAFSLVQPSLPSWKVVRAAMGEGREEEDGDGGSAGLVSLSPCRVLRLNGVEQRNTRVMTCLTTSLFAMDTQRYEKVEDEDATEELVIETFLHEYGANHFVRIGGSSANYSARAYMSLGGGRRRVIPERNIKVASDNRVKKLHRAFIGFIASAYNVDTNTSRFTVEGLKELTQGFEGGSGPDMSIVKIKSMERYHRVVSQRYVTKVQMAAVGGPATLALAAVVFKGAISVAVGEPNDADLVMNTGNRRQLEEGVWFEKRRRINWLTLCVLLLPSMALLYRST